MKNTFEKIVNGHAFADTETKRMLHREHKIKPLAPQIMLNNGMSISVQASGRHYCVPKTNKGPYTHVEVGVFNDAEVPEDWAKYEDDNNGVFGYVPVELVRKFIEGCGGEIENFALDYTPINELFELFEKTDKGD